jgi:hypothetical protein
MRIRIVNFVLCFAMLGATPAAAEEFQALEELFQSEIVFPQDEGEIQITVAPQYHWGRDARRTELGLGFEYGVTDAFQIGAELVSFARHDPRGAGAHEGIGDIELSARHSWMNIGGSRTHAALGLEVTLPTGDENRELGEGEFGFAPSAVVAVDLARGAQVFANFGVEFQPGADEAEERSQWFLNVGAFAPIGDFTATFEWNLSEHEGNYVTPGLVWRFAEGFEFGVGVPIGVNGAADRYRVIAMLTHEFGGDDD